MSAEPAAVNRRWTRLGSHAPDTAQTSFTIPGVRTDNQPSETSQTRNLTVAERVPGGA